MYILSRLNKKLASNRAPGTDFDGATYADDTSCFSADTKTINLLIEEIEEERFRYGWKLNKHKCELSTTQPAVNVHLQDNIKVPKGKTGYMSWMQHRSGNKQRRGTINKFLKYNGNHDNNKPILIKIYTADAILRSQFLWARMSWANTFSYGKTWGIPNTSVQKNLKTRCNSR